MGSDIRPETIRKLSRSIMIFFVKCTCICPDNQGHRCITDHGKICNQAYQRKFVNKLMVFASAHCTLSKCNKKNPVDIDNETFKCITISGTLYVYIYVYIKEIKWMRCPHFSLPFSLAYIEQLCTRREGAWSLQWTSAYWKPASISQT